MFMVRARRELYVHLSKYVGTAYAMWKPAFVFPKFEEPVFKVGVRPGHTGDEMLLMANTFRCPVHGKSRIVLPSEIFAELGYPESLECLGAGEAFYMFKLGTSPLTRH
jgi:hypothetical protein